MSYKVAITTSDGKLINQHFGHCSEFSIVEVDEHSGQWVFKEKRKIGATCSDFSHSEDHVREVAEALSDCKYLLTSRIGAYPYRALQQVGVTCLEAPELISDSLERLHQYYKLSR